MNNQKQSLIIECPGHEVVLQLMIKQAEVFNRMIRNSTTLFVQRTLPDEYSTESITGEMSNTIDITVSSLEDISKLEAKGFIKVIKPKSNNIKSKRKPKPYYRQNEKY